MINTRLLLCIISVISTTYAASVAQANTEAEFIKANKEYTQAYRDFLHFEKTALADYEKFSEELKAAKSAFEKSEGIYTTLDAELGKLNDELVANIANTQFNEDLIIQTQQEQKDTLDQAVADGLFQSGDVVDQDSIAEKAKVFSQKIAELESDVDGFKSEIAALQSSEPYSGYVSEQNKVTSELSQNQSNKRRYEERIAWFERRIRELNFNISTTEDEIVRLDALADEIRDEILPQYQSDKIVLENEIGNLNIDISDLETRLVRVRRRVRERRRELQDINSRLQARIQERDNLRAEANGLQAEIDKIPDYRQTINNIENNRLPKAKQNLANTDSKLSKVQSDINTKKGNLDEARQRLQNIKGRIDNLNAKIQTEQTELERLRNRKKNLQAQIAEAEGASKKEANLNNKIADAQQKIQSARQEKRRLNQEIEKKQSSVQSAQAELQSAQNQLQTARQQLKDLQGRKGNLQAQIKEAQGADQKVKQLNQQIKAARDKKQQAQAKVDQFKNQKQAKQAEKQQAKSEVDNFNGQISSKDQEIASVQARIDEIKSKLDKDNGKKKGLKKQLQELRQQKKALNQERQGLVKSRNQAQAKVKAANLAINGLNGKIENNRKVVQNQTQKIQSLQGQKQEVQALAGKLPELQNKLSNVNSKIQGKRQEINKHQSSVDAAKKKIGPVNQQIKQLQAKVGQQQTVINNQRDRKQKLEKQLADVKQLAQSLPKLKQQLANVQSKIDQSKSTLADLRSKKQQAQDRRQKVQARVDKLKGELQALRSQKQELQASKQKISQNIARMEQRLVNLRNKIQAANSNKPRLNQINNTLLPNLRQRIQALRTNKQTKQGEFDQAIKRRDRIVANLGEKTSVRDEKQRQLNRVDQRIRFERNRLADAESKLVTAQDSLVDMRDELVQRRREKRRDEDNLSMTKTLISENQQELFTVEKKIADYEAIHIQPIENEIAKTEVNISKEKLGEAQYMNLGSALQGQDDLIADKTDENKVMAARKPVLEQEIAELEPQVAQASSDKQMSELAMFEADKVLEQHKVDMTEKKPALEELEEKNFDLLETLAGN